MGRLRPWIVPSGGVLEMTVVGERLQSHMSSMAAGGSTFASHRVC
jgi:hypothetical protein